MKDLIIVGAGNAAREVLQIAKDINRDKETWRIKGFIADHGLDIKELTNGEFDVLGTIEEWEPRGNEVFTCAIADPKGREYVVDKLTRKGAIFTQIIHPSVCIHDYSTIGTGVIFYWDVFIGVNVHVGNFSTLLSGVAHDCRIGAFSTVSRGARLTGGVVLGKRCFIGANATIVPGKIIGDDVYVGAGSVVIRNVKVGHKVFGNPARRVDV